MARYEAFSKINLNPFKYTDIAGKAVPTSANPTGLTRRYGPEQVTYTKDQLKLLPPKLRARNQRWEEKVKRTFNRRRLLVGTDGVREQKRVIGPSTAAAGASTLAAGGYYADKKISKSMLKLRQTAGVGANGRVIHRRAEMQARKITDLDSNQRDSLRRQIAQRRAERLAGTNRRTVDPQQRGAQAAAGHGHRDHSRRYDKWARKNPAEAAHWDQERKVRIIQGKKPRDEYPTYPAPPRKSNKQRKIDRKANLERMRGMNPAQHQMMQAMDHRTKLLTPSYAFQMGAPTAAGAGGLAYVHDKRSVSKSMDKKERERAAVTAVGGASGAGLAFGGYTAGGWAAKNALRRYRDKNSTPESNKIWDDFRRKNNFGNLSELPEGKRAKVMMKYPKGVPGWQGQRILGFKNLPSVKAATIAGGGIAGAAYASSRSKND